MAKFKDGQSGNPAGRPKGAKNKPATFDGKELAEFIASEWPTFLKDYKKLEPADRAKCFIQLLEYSSQNNIQV